MPENPSQPPAAGRPISSIVGQPTAIVDSAEANVGIPKLSDAQFNTVMAAFNRIAEDATERLRRGSGD